MNLGFSDIYILHKFFKLDFFGDICKFFQFFQWRFSVFRNFINFPLDIFSQFVRFWNFPNLFFFRTFIIFPYFPHDFVLHNFFSKDKCDVYRNFSNFSYHIDLQDFFYDKLILHFNNKSVM